MIKDTGVIYVMNEAKKAGYTNNDDDWVNMGQGSPNTSNLIINNLNILPNYGDVGGLQEMKLLISNYYNYFYNINCISDNINISNGGRLCISKLFLLLKNKKFACISPDYTAYYELFNTLNIQYLDIGIDGNIIINMSNIINFLKKENIEVLIFSNPKNPTGHFYNDNELKELVKFLNKNNIIVIIDEMYSFFVYDDKNNKPLSICNSIKNIDKNNIIIINGLTKGWKLPGMRLCWMLTNKNIIKNINSLTSFIDGGPSILTQTICIKNNYLNIKYIENLYQEIQNEYNIKRLFLIEELLKLNFIINKNTNSTFYIFACTDNLPIKIQDGTNFLDECIKEKLIVVPGYYFNLTRTTNNNHFKNYVRFSYGCSLDKIKRGIEKINRIINKNK